jgi:predicted transposase
MMRTIVLKLRMDEAQKEALLRTMEAYTIAFNMAAEWGFRNRTCNRITTHFGTYRRIRDCLPGLNSSLV